MTLAPKSVTSPIAMLVAEQIGGVAALAAVFVLITGVIGAIAQVIDGALDPFGDGFVEQGAVFADKARHAGLGNAGAQGNTEMVTTGALLNGDAERFLRHDETEHPLYRVLCRSPNFEMTPQRFMLMVVAGVSVTYLRSQLELWDRLLQEFIVYLREYSQQAAQLQSAAQSVGEEAPVL